MTLFDGNRLTQDVMTLPVEAIRRGQFSDKYFENIVTILAGLSDRGTTFGSSVGDRATRFAAVDEQVGDVVVEAQVFNRRLPYALVGGVDAALALLRHASGVPGRPDCDDAWRSLEVEAVHDGTITEYDGQPENVHPVMRIRGRYRDFAVLETPILGYLTRVSRTATNTLNVLRAAGTKPVLYFPARFDLPEVQAADGYGYWLAVQRHAFEMSQQAGHPVEYRARVSTDAQGQWWGGSGGGTVPHALIAAFLGDTAAAMVAFAEHVALDVPRIVLADFNNDVLQATRDTLNAYWPRYYAALRAGDGDRQARWTLTGVRIDTAGNLLDASLTDDTDKGVSAALVRATRRAIDEWPDTLAVGDAELDVARHYAAAVQIIVTGGFNIERITAFESDGVPVDMYGVGSSLMTNDKTTNTDFTMDVVRANLNGRWVDVAKVGRRAGSHRGLQAVDLSEL
ncbi:MAG: nicotinate phosphoribosyltransferase [Chloroflexi bacterium]|nr:nicotinate phosphoribosyltransferase [Chloroflexota bacterium]